MENLNYRNSTSNTIYKFSNKTLNMITLMLSTTAILIAIGVIEIGILIALCMFPILNRCFKTILSIHKDKDYTILYLLCISGIQILVFINYAFLI